MSKSDLVIQDDYDTDVKAIWTCFLNIVLIGLYTASPKTGATSPTLGVQPAKPKWNVNEMFQLDLNIILENFEVNTDLWIKNESKLNELFGNST